MKRSELLETLSQDVLTYVMHGEFPEHHFVQQIKPEELDDRFADYETLVRLHFVLLPSVVSFVEALPERLRKVKTQTENVSRTRRGSVKGRINWAKTTRERYRRNPGDRSLFVCEDRSESYDVDENIVLKKLLSVIYDTLVKSEEYLRADYDWVTDRWQENLALIDTLKGNVERNVHVTRIRQPKSYEPTERMLLTAAESRQPIYRESAELLRRYRASLDGDESAIQNLLDSTAITPDDDETLYELFVLFRYISAIESLQEDRFELQTIRSEKQEVARVESDDLNAEIVVYHDSSAGDRDLSFDDTPEGEKNEFGRYEMVRQESVETLRQYFKNDDLDTQTGRPDVIVLEVNQEGSTEYLITEVKYSRRKETIRQGITETLEYLAFMQQDDEFVFDEGTNYFGDGWNGILAVRDLNQETASIADQEGQPIRILQASEFEARVDVVLENVFEGADK